MGLQDYAHFHSFFNTYSLPRSYVPGTIVVLENLSLSFYYCAYCPFFISIADSNYIISNSSQYIYLFPKLHFYFSGCQLATPLGSLTGTSDLKCSKQPIIPPCNYSEHCVQLSFIFPSPVLPFYILNIPQIGSLTGSLGIQVI